MPIDLTIHPEHQVLVGVFTGEIDIRTHLDAVARVPTLEGYREGLPRLYDFSGCRWWLSGYADMLRLLDALAQTAPPESQKVAIVGAQPGVKGMLRMFETLAAERLHELRFFDELDEAWAWLQG